jgi:hypothetical protein
MEWKRTSLWLVVCLAVSLLPQAFASPQSSNLTELEN